MLPDVALLTCNAVRAIVKVLAMNTAARTVEGPFFFGGKVLELLLVPGDPLLKLSFRTSSLTFSNELLFLCCSSEFFFGKDPFELPILDALFSGHHARLSVLLHLFLPILISTSCGKVCGTFSFGLGSFLFALLSFLLVCQSR